MITLWLHITGSVPKKYYMYVFCFWMIWKQDWIHDFIFFRLTLMLLLCPWEIVKVKIYFYSFICNYRELWLGHRLLWSNFIFGELRRCNVDLDIDTTLTCIKTEPQTLNFFVCCTYIYYVIMRGVGGSKMITWLQGGGGGPKWAQKWLRNIFTAPNMHERR